MGKIIVSIVKIFGSDKSEPNKDPRVIKEPYGSSEPCYCGSEKKYKHCCKKINKREDKIAIKITKNTRKGKKQKVKVMKVTRLPRLFQNYTDSGMDPINFD